MRKPLLISALACLIWLPPLLASQEAFDLLRKGDVQAVKALVERSPRLVEIKDGDGNTLLHIAAGGKDAAFAAFLIDKGAKVEALNASKKTPLHIAAMSDRGEIVALLLKRGAALETKDDYDRTALVLCARQGGQAATGRLLIEAGADLNVLDRFGDCALSLAAWRGKADFIDLLLEKGAKIPGGELGWRMVFISASQGLTNLFRRLVADGRDLKALPAQAPSLLHSAAAGGSAEIISALLDAGLDPARPDSFGWTPLHYAARDGRADAARKLIERGAPLNARNMMGQTAYNVAQERTMSAAAAVLEQEGADTSAIRFPELTGDYLGQKPPAGRPELFGRGIISSIWGLHSTAVFSPDGNEVLWAPMIEIPGRLYTEGGLLMMKRVDGRWTPPGYAPFSGPGQGDDVPFFTPDGKRLYFISTRPLPGESGPQKERIWYVERIAGGWGKPQMLDAVVNDHALHWSFSLDKDGNLYFGGGGADSLGRQDVYVARFVNGKYEKPVSLGAPVCSADAEQTPFVAWDGSYLVYQRGMHLAVSFPGADGAWSAPIDLGPEVNSEELDLCPAVTADGKYLFFVSQREGESHAYWVKTDVIEKLRPAAKPDPAPASALQDVFEALGKGDLPTVQSLVEKTPRLVEARDAEGLTPLHYAAFGKNVDLVNLLLDKGAEIEARNAEKTTPLQIAAMMDRAEVAAALIRRGAALETRDDYGRTPLILCARERGQAVTGRLLLEAGADIAAVDKFGDSALSLAAWRGKADFVDLLLEKGAKVPIEGEKAQEALSLAVSKGLTGLFRRITESGIQLKAAAAGHAELLHRAAEGGSAEIVAALLDLGLDPARADRLGWTPLHYAARDGRADAARKLIERGAPLDARTTMGQTAYNVALERKMDAVAALLKDKGAQTSAMRFPELKGDYLGQKPPGAKPELFGPGIVSSIWGLHSTAVFSPAGNEVVWHPMELWPGEVYSRGGLLMMKRVNGRWVAPALMSFSTPSQGDDQPFFSSDGKRLYFISSRPLPGRTGGSKERIWYADRDGAGWSEPKPLDAAVNALNLHWQFSLDRNGNLHFAGVNPDTVGAQDIYVARFVDGKYETPVSLGAPVCTTGIDDTPFIAPDGSYLLFSQEFDLCVSFRNADGTWSVPVNLGPEINSDSIELCPMVTADGKYLFFLSQRGGQSHAYWVKADVIERLRPRSSFASAAAATDEKAVIERVIRDNIGWALTKDRPLAESTMAHDEGLFIFNPDSRSTIGWSQLEKNFDFWMDPRFKALTCEIWDLRIGVSRSGEAAWWSCMLNDLGEWDGKPTGWKDTRWTGVMEKRQGKWLIVQMHFSFASDKVAAQVKAKLEADKAVPNRR